MMLHKVKFKKRRSSRTPSTFTTSENPHLVNDNKLHSKSTYFYRWGSRLNYVIPSVCALALLVGGIITINPILNNIEQASASRDSQPSPQADGEMAVYATPSITLGITGSGQLSGNVTAGTVAYVSNIITVGGNNMDSYALTLSAAGGETGELVGENKRATVGKVGQNVAPTNFPDNTWGYAISTVNSTGTANNSLRYNSVPSSTNNNGGTKIVERKLTSSSVNDSYKITFAAKLGSHLPADHYKANVYLSAVANPEYTIGITTMQQMTTAICSSIPESDYGKQFRLKDERDGKIYWVSRLKDGNCWMTQNLAYDGGGIKQCTVNSNNKCTGWPSSNDGKARYAIGSHSDANHSSQGNYYSWEAAVNGDTGTTEPKQGVCPNNWQLPTSNNTNSKSFGSLTNTYNIDNSPTGSATLRADPLYFAYGGKLDNGELDGATGSASYWASTPYDGVNGRALYFNTSYVGPSNGYPSYYGFSVRCVAR